MSVIIRINDEEFSSFEEFGTNIYRFFDEAFKLINTSKFLNLLKNENHKFYEGIMMLRSEETDNDAFIFKVQYLFCPLMELKFRTYKFSSLKSLGNKILNGNPKVDIYILDLIKNKLLSYYLKIQGYDKLNSKLFKRVEKIEEEYILNPNRAYFKIGFVLAETQKIVYRRRWYDNLSSFIQEILKPTEIHDFCESFEKSQYLFAWLEILGYENVIDKYQSIVSVTQEWEDK